MDSSGHRIRQLQVIGHQLSRESAEQQRFQLDRPYSCLQLCQRVPRTCFSTPGRAKQSLAARCEWAGIPVCLAPAGGVESTIARGLPTSGRPDWRLSTASPAISVGARDSVKSRGRFASGGGGRADVTVHGSPSNHRQNPRRGGATSPETICAEAAVGVSTSPTARILATSFNAKDFRPPTSRREGMASSRGRPGPSMAGQRYRSRTPPAGIVIAMVDGRQPPRSNLWILFFESTSLPFCFDGDSWAISSPNSPPLRDQRRRCCLRCSHWFV